MAMTVCPYCGRVFRGDAREITRVLPAHYRDMRGQAVDGGERHPKVRARRAA